MRPLPLPCSLLAAFALTLVTPSRAQACGGTFCDNTGVPMPVDQTGEDILFVRDGPHIEVHIRIEYTGEAERFAWVVPLQAVPEVSVGSEPLFSQLAAATAPRWIRQRSFECPDDEPWDDSGGLFIDNDLAGAGGGPDVVLQETVGAFEVVVLQGGDATELVDFLIENGYAQDPVATPIIQEYLDEGFLFAAVKLTAGVEADAIHPLVFRLLSDEPCVPIRLTRIAAEEDMGIRTYFLGQERWAPLNYRHVVVNPLAFPWDEAGPQTNARYAELLTLAVDAAGGHAFATEYAGSPSVVSPLGIYRAAWDESAFVGVDMIQAMSAIVSQQLNTHPLIQSLLLEYMPPPEGVPAQTFWNNIGAYADQVDVDNWNSAGFAAAVAERIIEPGLHAVDLLDAWPVLTRLHTTMSPHEMTVDPMFQPAPTLGEVDNRLTASSVELCDDAGTRYMIPFGDQSLPVCLSGQATQWPAELREHPALRIEQIPPMGPPQVLQDLSLAILAGHAAYQADKHCELGDGDDGGHAGDGDGTDGGGPALGDDGRSGSKIDCACRSDAGGSGGAAFGLLALAWLGRRVRRRGVKS